jgi:hypothetical protein
MVSVDAQGAEERAARALLADIESGGVRLSLTTDGGLVFDGPGSVPRAQMAALMDLKGAVVSLLRRRARDRKEHAGCWCERNWVGRGAHLGH